MSANLFNQSLGFISSLFVVRFLKPEELGEARIIATYGGYVVLLGSLGLGASVLTYVPRSNNPGCRRRWLQVTLAAAGAATLVLSLVAVLLSSRGWLMSNAHTAYWYRWSLLGGLATSASTILIAFYQAERAVRQLAGIQSAVRVLALVAVVGGAWLAGFVGYIVAGIFSAYLLLGGLVVVRMRNQATACHVPLPAGYVRVAALALLGALLWNVGRSADVVILDRVAADRVQFGCYALALTITAVLSIMTQTIQVVVTPFFSAHHQDAEWVLRNAGKWQVAATLASLVGAVLLFSLGSLLIHHIYGVAYTPAISFLIPLLLTQCLLSTFHIQSAALLGMGLVRINTMVGGVVVPFSILATFLLALKYGIWGAVWAQLLSAAFYAALQSIWGWMALASKSLTCANTEGPP